MIELCNYGYIFKWCMRSFRLPLTNSNTLTLVIRCIFCFEPPNYVQNLQALKKKLKQHVFRYTLLTINLHPSIDTFLKSACLASYLCQLTRIADISTTITRCSTLIMFLHLYSPSEKTLARLTTHNTIVTTKYLSRRSSFSTNYTNSSFQWCPFTI